MTADFNALAIQTAIKDMVRKGFFSICVIDDILKMTGTIPNGEAYRALRLLHCVSFMDMPPKMLEALPDMIRACINGPTLEITLTLQPSAGIAREFRVVEAAAVEAPATPERQGFLRRLLK